MTGESTIDYEGLAQEAMRGVVRKVLARTAKFGLIGDHHFYISFDTEAPGVTLSKRLREKYPREMTIVLQHRFWDLAVSEDRFEVKLTFDGIPERLVVPFSAIKVFFDPSVRFGLQFEEGDARPDEADAFDALTPQAGAAQSGRTRNKPLRRPKPQPVEAVDGEQPAPQDIDADPPEPTVLPTASARTANAPNEAAKSTSGKEGEGGEEAADTSAGAEIVSLDQFRKK